MKRFLMVFITVMAAVSINAQSLEGSWLGKLELGGMSLRIVFNLTRTDSGTLACTLDSPDQGAKGIAAEVISSDPAKLKIAVKQINATYEGALTDDVLKGTFTQNGYSFPLEMKRGAVKTNRPQTPQPPFPYATEEVKFTNEKDPAVLAGTLVYPVGYKQTVPVPVVIMVTGSGLQNRDEELFEHKPFLVIADYLARNGIASLRYDDRGFAKSTGNAANATTEDFMQDAVAGVAWLRSQGKKFSRIGVLGHSEGATIAFMLAAKDKADFIVSLAGPGVKGDTILAWQLNHQMERQGLPNRTTTQEVRQQVSTQGTAWQKYFINFDPATVIAATRCPVMAINGTNDQQVTPNLNFSVIERLLPKNSKNLLRLYDGLNHLLQHSSTGNPEEYGRIEETLAPEVLKDLKEWIIGLEK